MTSLPYDMTSKQRSVYLNTGPTLCWGTRAGVPDGGGRQQPVALGGRNVGNRSEGGRDCFTSSITVTG